MNYSEQSRTNRAERTAITLLAVLCSLFLVRCLSWAANESYLNYLKGMSEERAGNTAKAIEAYEQAVQQDPQAIQVYRDLAELRLRSGQPEAALKAAERVKDLAPNDPMSYIFLGNVWVAQGDLAKAAGSYEQALKLDPANLRALENLGNYYALVHPEKAITYYQRYLEISPRDADIHFQLGIVHHKRGEFLKALASYKRSLENDPGQLVTHMALADLYEVQKSTKEAINAYTKAAEIQPNNPLVLTRLGSLLYRDSQWELAGKAYESAGKASPHEPTIHYWLARIAEERRDWKSAASHAEQAWELSQDVQFLPLAAYYLTVNREPAKAVKYLEKARALDPDNANVLLFLGMNYMDLSKHESAREALAKGVALYPKDPQIRFHLGMAEDKLGHFDAAMEQFQAVLKLDPNHSPSMNYLGYSWAERGIRLPEAEKLLRRAVELEPQSGAYLDSLGWVRYKQGDFKEARHYLEKAAFYTRDSLIYDHLGDAYFAEKVPAAALQAWSKALYVEPTNEAIRKKVAEEGKRFLGSPDGKKYAAYLEGNFKQVKNLLGMVHFKGKLAKRGLQVAGKITYERPDKIILDVPATPKTEATRFVLNGSERRMEPPAKGVTLQAFVFEGLAAFAKLLSEPVGPSFKVDVEPATGVRVTFARPNPSGGDDVIEVIAYDFVEGIWLPEEIRLKNATTGWTAELSFSDWDINSEPRALAVR